MAACNNGSRISEGLESIRRAEKCLKTGVFKWKSDYDGAAVAYTKAGTYFRNAKSYDQSRQCFVLAAEAHFSNNSFFQGAKCLEQAALICRDIGNLVETADLMEKACNLFIEHGTPDTALLSIEKAAQIIQHVYPLRAIHLFKKGVEIAEMEDRTLTAAELLDKASRLEIKCKLFDDAANSILEQMKIQNKEEKYSAFCRLAVSLVLVHLTRGDYVAADKAFNDALTCPGFQNGEERETLYTMLHAYDEGDEEEFLRALSQPHIRYMDTEYAKLARDLQIPNTHKDRIKASAILKNESLFSGTQEEEDEFASGIC